MPRYFSRRDPFGKYAKGSIDKARKLRREMTDAERKLWSKLRNEQLGIQFRRQVPVGPYVVDFICIKQCHSRMLLTGGGLVIEVDGGQHYTEEGLEYDKIRTAYLESEGLTVKRFGNHDVLRNIDGVVRAILESLEKAGECCEPHPRMETLRGRPVLPLIEEVTSPQTAEDTRPPTKGTIGG
jgi:very-short-patch-repair endonuclease